MHTYKNYYVFSHTKNHIQKNVSVFPIQKLLCSALIQKFTSIFTIQKLLVFFPYKKLLYKNCYTKITLQNYYYTKLLYFILLIIFIKHFLKLIQLIQLI